LENANIDVPTAVVIDPSADFSGADAVIYEHEDVAMAVVPD